MVMATLNSVSATRLACPVSPGSCLTAPESSEEEPKGEDQGEHPIGKPPRRYEFRQFRVLLLRDAELFDQSLIDPSRIQEKRS